MKKINRIAQVAASLLMMNFAHAAPLTSFFPSAGLGPFLAEHFDLATIRSSLGPRRTHSQRTFAEIGLKPSIATETTLIVAQAGNWLYRLDIIGRRDVNGDGLEDLEVCFTDQAHNGGTYSARQGLLITRYSPTSLAVALSYSLDSACHAK